MGALSVRCSGLSLCLQMAGEICLLVRDINISERPFFFLSAALPVYCQFVFHLVIRRNYNYCATLKCGKRSGGRSGTAVVSGLAARGSCVILGRVAELC